MAALVVPKVDAGIISDVEMLLDAFKAKHSVRRLHVTELVEFEEVLLKTAFEYVRPIKKSKMGVQLERTLTERVFGVYATYVFYYAQPVDYVAKISVTPPALVELREFIEDVLLPGRHLDTIGCIYKLFADDAFSTVAFLNTYDPICHRGYRQPQIEDVVDEDEKHTPLEAANFVMSNPILKTMAHVQREIEQTQEQIPGGPAVAEKKDNNFLTRLNKIYATLKREVEKVDIAQTDDADQESANSGNEQDGNSNGREAVQGPSQRSIKDKAYASSVAYARNRRYADPNMHENFRDLAVNQEDAADEVLQSTAVEQPASADAAPSPKKRKRKPKPPFLLPSGDHESGIVADASDDVPLSSKRRQRSKGSKRSKGNDLETMSISSQPSSIGPSIAAATSTGEKTRTSRTPMKPVRPPVDAEFEAEMRRIEELLEDRQGEQVKKLLAKDG